MELERDSAATAASAGDPAGLAGGWELVQHDWGLRTLDTTPGRVWRATLGAARWLARGLRCHPAPAATEARR